MNALAILAKGKIHYQSRIGLSLDLCTWFKNTRPVITMAEVKALARSAHLIEPKVDVMIGSYLITRLT